MRTYQDALDRLAGRRSRKLENNTYLETRPDGSIAVRLHSTDVVTYHQDGQIVLDSGGWQTVTTKDRINKYSPFRVWQVRRIWYVCNPGAADPQELPYRDGMRLGFTGGTPWGAA